MQPQHVNMDIISVNDDNQHAIRSQQGACDDSHCLPSTRFLSVTMETCQVQTQGTWN